MLRGDIFQKGQRTGHLNGLTPDEQWKEINPYRKHPRQVKKVSFWNGLLKGYVLDYK